MRRRLGAAAMLFTARRKEMAWATARKTIKKQRESNGRAALGFVCPQRRACGAIAINQIRSQSNAFRSQS